MAVNYKKRLVEGLLELNLKTMGGVLIQGSKACGKTTTAEQFAKSKLMLADERPEFPRGNYSHPRRTLISGVGT